MWQSMTPKQSVQAAAAAMMPTPRDVPLQQHGLHRQLQNVYTDYTNGYQGGDYQYASAGYQYSGPYYADSNQDYYATSTQDYYAANQYADYGFADARYDSIYSDTQYSGVVVDCGPNSSSLACNNRRGGSLSPAVIIGPVAALALFLVALCCCSKVRGRRASYGGYRGQTGSSDLHKPPGGGRPGIFTGRGIAADGGSAGAVSYTHLTLPTTPYV